MDSIIQTRTRLYFSGKLSWRRNEIKQWTLLCLRQLFLLTDYFLSGRPLLWTWVNSSGVRL